jgi:hypothetical protein
VADPAWPFVTHAKEANLPPASLERSRTNRAISNESNNLERSKQILDEGHGFSRAVQESN